jgi:hypothetical protein
MSRAAEAAAVKPNRVSLADLLAMSLADALKLPTEQIALLADDLVVANKELKAQGAALLVLLDRRYGARAQAKRHEEKKDTGTVRLDDGDFEIAAGLPKNVSWSQPLLASLWEKIRESGDDPGQYIDVEYSMPEDRYSALPEHLRRPFESARTVKTGKPTYKIERKEK